MSEGLLEPKIAYITTSIATDFASERASFATGLAMRSILLSVPSVCALELPDFVLIGSWRQMLPCYSLLG